MARLRPLKRNPGAAADNRSRIHRRGLKLDFEHPWRHENIARLLTSSVMNWQEILVSGLRQQGFPNLRASHMNLLRYIDVDGTRITEIAARSLMTKQGVGQLVVACEREGLVRTIPDRADGRAKIVTFTKLGKSVIEVEREVIERMDVELEKLLSKEAFLGLRRALTLITDWKSPFARARKTGPQARRTRS
jgi:DNA-binding MarR family transcriptional regulator